MKTWLLFALLSSSLLHAQTIFPSETLRQLEKEGGIFKEPKLICYLKAALGKNHLDALQERMKMIEWNDKPNAAGAFEFVGGVRGLFSIMEGMIAIHPDGRIWAAYLEVDDSNQNHIHYFSNDPVSQKSAPEAITKWADRFSGASWAYDSAKGAIAKIAADCSDEKLKEQNQKYHEREKGELCDDKREFWSLSARRIVSNQAKRVAFEGQRSYLVDGDIVLVARNQPKEKKQLCVSYARDFVHRTVGWIPADATAELDAAFLKTLLARPVDLSAWAGKWKTPYAALNISVKGTNQLIVSGNAMDGANVGEIEDELYQVKGAAAFATKEDDGICKIDLYHLNNAIYLDETGNCGGIGVTFAGAYFRAPDEKVKSTSSIKRSTRTRLEREEKHALEEAGKTKQGEQDKKIIKDVYEQKK